MRSVLLHIMMKMLNLNFLTEVPLNDYPTGTDYLPPANIMLNYTLLGVDCHFYETPLLTIVTACEYPMSTIHCTIIPPHTYKIRVLEKWCKLFLVSIIAYK